VVSRRFSRLVLSLKCASNKAQSLPTGNTICSDQEQFKVTRALFEIRGVSSIWILGNEVTVTKVPGVSWGNIKAKIVETIKQVES